MDIQQLLRDYVSQPDVMQLATVKDGQPWACTVHFFADENLRLYWMSTPATRHSQEVAGDQHAAVAMAICAERSKPPIGVQMEGDALLIEDTEEMRRVVPQYLQKLGRKPEILDELLNGTSKNLLYRFTPRLCVVFDPATWPNEPRKEWRP